MGGRKTTSPFGCRRYGGPRIWRCENGKFLLWYHNHSDKSGGGWTGRNPVWISGGVERDGFIHWSQPEILLYDPEVSKKISYPDLIEQDGRAKASWDCDPGILEPGKLHHVAVVVDSGPGIIRFVVDGLLCDGGDARHYGWGRLPEPLGNLRGSGKLRIAPSLHGHLKTLRLYLRPLRTSEAIAHFHAGPPS